MDLSGTSFASPVAGKPTHGLTASWQFVRSHDIVLFCLSLALLVLSSVDNGPLGGIVKLSWLASIAALTFVNIGAAFVAYICALAIYSPLHVEGWSSAFQRPDNYAIVIVFAGMLFLAVNQKHRWPRFDPYVSASLILFTLHGLIFSRLQFAALLKTILIPLVACELLAAIELEERELDALQIGMAVLGGYIGLVSILERTAASEWMLPYWVGNPSLRPLDPSLDEWIGSGRSGGTLMQPAFNGLLLSLIICILLLRSRRGRSWLSIIAISLCAAGAFFTYTRAVWLGLAVSLIWFPGWCRSFRQAYLRRVALACIAAGLLVVAAGMARERLQDSGTIYYRFNLWGAGLRLVEAHPLFGIGFLQFGSAMRGTEQGFGSLLPSAPDVEEDVPSHNTLLTVLAEFGGVGFLFYMAAFFRIVQRAKNNACQLWGRSGAAWVLAFVIVYLVNAQFVSAFEVSTNVVFFGVLGAIAGARA
jgi:O-Antigen ligase